MNALLQDQKHCKKHRKLIRQGLVRLYASTHTYSPTHHASCTLISLTCTAHSYMIATCRIGLLQVLAPHSPCESPYPLGVCARCNLSRALFLPALRREHTARSSRGSSSSVTTRVTTRARLRTTGKTGHASSRGVCVPSVCVPMHRVRSPPVVDAAGPEQSRGCSLWSFLSTALGEKLKRHSRGMTAGLTAGVLLHQDSRRARRSRRAGRSRRATRPDRATTSTPTMAAKIRGPVGFTSAKLASVAAGRSALCSSTYVHAALYICHLNL